MNATGVELLLFDHEDDIRPARVIRPDPFENRTYYYYWHLFVPEVHAGQIYAYRIDGAFDPASGPLALMPRATSSLREPRRRRRSGPGPGPNRAADVSCSSKSLKPGAFI
jgi:hypothetical protein